jgi:hypothetical protein
VTEEEWNTCSDVTEMITFLSRAGKLRKRTSRLFACVRRIWPLLQDECCRNAVETVERYVDGTVGEEELSAARDAVVRLWWEHSGPHSHAILAVAITARTKEAGHFPDPVATGMSASRLDVSESAAVTAAIASQNWSGERVSQCGILRDLVKPFARFSVPETSPLTPAVLDLARDIYEQHSFDRLPELALALEEAGCTNQDILNHCREPGPHVRGCWALDAVLGKS